ncbi:MAG: hypothetical protein HPY82_04660 [Gammaproteobacteria bacterium]|nr:hypothetical protein [Gammaproteobacteria bacterium]
MKTLHLRALVGLLLLTLFSQTLLAATRMVHCAFAANVAAQESGQQHCHEEGHEGAVAAHITATDSSPGNPQHSPDCQPDCSCCWNACSASLLVDTCSALTLIPVTETYHATSELLPASPVEQSLRPPRFA